MARAPQAIPRAMASSVAVSQACRASTTSGGGSPSYAAMLEATKRIPL